MPPDRAAALHTDLSDDHPISFVYDSELYEASDGQLRDPENLDDAVLLDVTKRVQCTSCHDAHNNKFGKFLVMDNAKSALCVTCHDQEYWERSIHRESGKGWNGRSSNPWPRSKRTSVAENGCSNCHRQHAAGAKERLLKFAEEEENCLSCHNGNVAAKNLRSVFRKLSTHNVGDTTGVHDPTEDAVNPTRHVECYDCHNAHAANKDAGQAPNASGALLGVKGIDTSGAVIREAKYEYQICYRCHADSKERGTAWVDRASPETNVRLEFDAANASYHPVEARGRNASVPSLIQPLDEASLIYCSDCHSDDGGTKGPHGSKWSPILAARLLLTDFSNESAAIYALCYKCHSRSSVLADESFKFHNKHVKEEQTACTTCHDPHAAKENSKLINFNRDYVSPHNGTMEFIDGGNYSGSCTLTCHGAAHDNKEY